MKQMKSYRLKTTTRLQLTQLTEQYKCTETEIIEKGVDILEILMLIEETVIGSGYMIKGLNGQKFKIELVGDESV